jgi:hypothetical protein
LWGEQGMRASSCGHTREPVGGHRAQKPWRLDEGGTARRIVQLEFDARARIKVIEIVEKIADMP